MTHMKVDCHSLQCQLVFEGRTKLWQHDDTPEQWEVKIGGHTLPQLTNEAYQDLKAQSRKPWSERVEPEMKALAEAVILYDSDARTEDMKNNVGC